MALEESSFTLQSSTDDQFEGLEMAEFDPNMLRELLDEPDEDVESGGATMQAAAEVVGPDSGLTLDNYLCVEDMDVDVQEFDWVDMTEETHLPCNYMEAAWYGEPCMEEINGFLDMGSDFSVSYSAVMSEEIGYIGLWQEN